MDELDKEILMALQHQARISELGKSVALSQPAVTERVRRMEEKGVIDHYRAVVSPNQVNKPISAYLLFHTKDCERFVAYCRDFPDVIELHRISGQYNFLVKMVAVSLQTLEDGINALGVYGDSTTFIVLSSPIQFKNIVPSVKCEK